MAIATHRTEGSGASRTNPILVHGPISAFADTRRACERVAAGPGPVLLIGESGTGKETLARFIHAQGPRAAGPFVTVGCASVPEDTLKIDLVGHVAGALPGVAAERQGRIALANGGTLFVDEIGGLSPALQVVLVGLLTDGCFEPLGGRAPVGANVRLIVASDRDLRLDVEAGRFRLDLYYLISAGTIRVPSLRQRRDDIPLLFQHFWKLRGEGRQVDAAVIKKLCDYDFPGNVRELEHLVGRIALACDRRRISLQDVPIDAFGSMRSERQDVYDVQEHGVFKYPGFPCVPIGLPVDLPGVLKAMEKTFIEVALSLANNNKKEAAALLGMRRTTLVEKLRRRWAAEKRRRAMMRNK